MGAVVPPADRLYIEAHGDPALLADRVGHLGRVSHTGVGTAKDRSALWFEVRPSRRIDAAMARERLAALGVEPCVDLIAEVQPSQGHVLARQPTLFALEAWDAMRTPSARLKALVADAECYRWRLVLTPVAQLAPGIASTRLNGLKVSRIVEQLRANAVPLPVTAFISGEELVVVDGHHRIAAFRGLNRATIPTMLGERKDAMARTLADAG